MLALIAMQELDEVSSVFTGWDLGGAKPEEESSQEGPNAAMIHGIEQMTGKVQIYRNGAVELVSPCACAYSLSWNTNIQGVYIWPS